MKGCVLFFTLLLALGGSAFGEPPAQTPSSTAPPAASAARVEQANAYFQKGQVDSAIITFEQAVVASPGDPDLRAQMGYLYAKVGRIDDAIAAYRKAVEIDPKDAQSLGNLG